MRVLPITDAANAYGQTVVDRLKKANIRATLDGRSEKIGAKIRDAEVFKVPYMFVIGGREVEQNAVAIRKHGSGDQGTKPVDDAVAMLLREIATKGLEQSGNA